MALVVLLAARPYIQLRVAGSFVLPSAMMGHNPILPLPHLSKVASVPMEMRLHGWHFALFSRMPGNATLTVGILRCSQGLLLEPGKMDMADPTAGVSPAAQPPPR